MNFEDFYNNNDITEDSINMKNNGGIQMEFSKGSLEHFWASQLETYRVFAEKALAVLLPFATTYRCKQNFPACFTSNQKPEIDWIIRTACE